MRMLVSVRNASEAVAAHEGGADLIDLKEPSRGALGGLDLHTIREIVSTLRRLGSTLPVSATIGDVPVAQAAEIVDRVAAVAACGVDLVKVGVERGADAALLIDRLAGLPADVVPVLIVDRGLDTTLVERACHHDFPALMVDTAEKGSGTLFDVVTSADLHRFIARVRASGRLAGVAGALRAMDAARLVELDPDFAGFRSAVCAGDRSGELDLDRLAALRRQIERASAQRAALLATVTSPELTAGD
jgi:uncharacterized protein (UPF0264 family)